jgi:hypothetical protein
MKSHVKALIVWSLLAFGFFLASLIFFVVRIFQTNVYYGGTETLFYFALPRRDVNIAWILAGLGFLCLIGVLVNGIKAINHSSDEIVDRQETEATVILDLQQRVKALEQTAPKADSTPVETPKEPEPSVIEPSPVTPEPEAPEASPAPVETPEATPTPEPMPSEPEPRPEEAPKDSPSAEPAPALERKTLHFCPRCGNKIDLAPSDDFCPVCGERLRK